MLNPNTLKFTCFSSLLLLLVACGGSGNSDASGSNQPAPPPTLSTFQQVVDSAVNQVDGMILYIDQAGQDPILLAGGMSDASAQTPMTTNNLFKIASISKLFIAVAASKLANEGVLSLQDTLGMWLPQYIGQIENAETITLEQMLRHRSGIPDFDSQAGFSWQNPHSDRNLTLAFALNKPADFAPDARYEYSNTNYLLIANVLDQALGFGYETYIQNEVLIPLALLNTFSNETLAPATQLSRGYWLNRDRKDQSYRIPGGEMISTAQDIAVFIHSLNRGTLLSAQERQLYPYFYNHSGWLPGYQSVANYYSDIDTVIVQFINTTGGNSEAVATQSLNQTLDILRR